MLKLLDFAPMESLGSVVFRRAHARLFGGVDRYFIAFVTPTREPHFTERQLREIAPEANVGFVAVPQLLTRRAEDFIWAAHALADLGYREVNFNLGCPAGTVTAKGKGAGFLRSPDELERFFAAVFEKPLPIAVSLKTRLGWSDVSEFERLADVFNHFPFASVTVHARLKTDLYRGHARLDAFEDAVGLLVHPVIYNGDIVTDNDYELSSGVFRLLRASWSDEVLLPIRRFFANCGAARAPRLRKSISLRKSFSRATAEHGTIGKTPSCA